MSELKITSIDGLRGLQIKKLSLRGCKNLVNLKPLLDCKNLVSLIIPTHLSRDIDYLREMPLKYISIDQYNFSSSYNSTTEIFWKEYDKNK